MSSKQLVVLGMHRSGTSMLTHLLHVMGCYVGPAEELVPANPQNPKGFWERIDANTIDRDILRLCGASWCFLSTFTRARMPGDTRAAMDARIRAVTEDLGDHPLSVIKEPRMCLLFDVWRDHFPDPICVFIVRRPTEVGSSLRRRDGFPMQVGIALWELYTRSALRASEGLPRCIVWHHEVMDRPADSVRRLHEALHAAGAEGLRLPDIDVLNTVVCPGLRSRAGLESDTGEFLNGSQMDLYRYLKDGDLSRPAPGQWSLGAQATLRSFQDGYTERVLDRLAAAGRERETRAAFAQRWEYLANACNILLDSMRWKFGHGVFSIFDRLRGGVPAPQPAEVIRDALESGSAAGLPPIASPDVSSAVLFDTSRRRRVVAIMFTHNEERFIEGAIRHFASHGVEIYLCDNGSTDATVDIARSHLGRGVMRIERIPRGPFYDLRSNLLRLEELSGILGADWILRADPDERHLPPWDGTLAEAFARVEEQGYNAVNFMELVFIPDRECPDHDHPEFESTMDRYYPFEPRHPHQLTAWKQPARPVDIAWSGGHRVRFPGLKMFPRPFLMKHYLFLSAGHAVEKYVRRDFHPAAVDRGWHGWRAVLRAEDIRLPPRAELRRWPEDNDPDLSDPWKAHWFDRETGRRESDCRASREAHE